ncbi:hypothetical protein SODALDRAFT_324706 [Sodiomyces alkalinus F11]|uniref:Life-span regulatory factor n=1 Tax=Sodiomyces alkalinus (strain CBS 110278 / VKM F-3762 / F11) TaxID=1314773 RepID=A0A3N2PV00_SODAK|nr:hypothetical protein SODALDRAFT_324706 [Sodiomyces alkalinus F11]ROT38332.1 hypothetical protein SODALDRAFT_324706 [Sodiomyces alkalinus F11]
MHHHRRKSGHGLANTSMTDVRKAVTATDPTRLKRPTTSLSRRTTPVAVQKLGRNPKDRERDWQESWYDERESFPQYCMTCEKQFLPHDEKHLYCSEACRKCDQTSSPIGETRHELYGHNSTTHALYAEEIPEHRDIIPRASPSRPDSNYFHPPLARDNGTSHYHTSAISALRSLNVGASSPPSSSLSAQSSLWPFARSGGTSPSTSYGRVGGSTTSCSAYEAGWTATGHGLPYSSGAGGMDRPLPTRRPTGYARPKSIELVTPMVGR